MDRPPLRAFVTGANRGIGLELVRQLLARGDAVIAAAREPGRADALAALDPGDGRLRVVALDVADAASVAAVAAALGDDPIDLLINNAGVWGGERQRLADLDFAAALRTYEVDALGALRVTLALLPHLRRGRGKQIVHVTSGMGSIGDNSSGGAYAYRMAKAALNMMSKSLAVDLAPDGIASVVINPGWVQTDMGGSRAPTTVADSVRGMLRAIDGLTVAGTGGFLDWRGGEYPW